MIDTLTAEKEEEIAHKDACVDQFNKNSLQTEENTRSKDSLSTKIEDLTQTVAASCLRKLTKRYPISDWSKSFSFGAPGRARMLQLATHSLHMRRCATAARSTCFSHAATQKASAIAVEAPHAA